jgi:opacity protein-like surface antigen
MKKLTGVLALTAILTTAAQASLNLGLSVLFDNNDLDSGVGVAVPSVGWQLTDNMSVNHSIEAELAFLGMDGDASGVSYDGRAIPLMLNYQLDWNPNELFGLYVGAGLGVSFNSLDGLDTQGTADKADDKQLEIGKTSFAYQLQLGTHLTFAEHYRINLGYRHLNTGDSDSYKDSIHEIMEVDGAHNIIDLGFQYRW